MQKIDYASSHKKEVLEPILKKIVKGSLPINEELLWINNIGQPETFLALSEIIRNLKAEVLELYSDFFKKNKTHPILEKALFSLSTWNHHGNNVKRLDLLLKCGVDPNTVYSFKHIEEKGLGINRFEFLGKTPLFFSEHGACTKTLLQYGADIHKVNEISNILSPLFKNNDLLEFAIKLSEKKVKVEDLQILLNNNKISKKEYQDAEKLINRLDNNGYKFYDNEIKKFLKNTPFEENVYQYATRKRAVAKLKQFNALIEQQEKYQPKEMVLQKNQERLEEKKQAYKHIETTSSSSQEKAYWLLVKAMQEDNTYVLEHLEKFEDLIKNNKKYGKNLLFSCIDSNRLDWIEKLWKLEYLPQDAITEYQQNYFEYCMSKSKIRPLIFFIYNTNFAIFDAKTFESIKEKIQGHGKSNPKYIKVFNNIEGYLYQKQSVELKEGILQDKKHSRKML